MLYLASFIIIVVAIAGMAIGVMFGRPAIKGSCGGIAGECALGRPKNLGDLRLMREEVETLGRRVKNAVDMGSEQWPMANCDRKT